MLIFKTIRHIYSSKEEMSGVLIYIRKEEKSGVLIYIIIILRLRIIKSLLIARKPNILVTIAT